MFLNFILFHLIMHGTVTITLQNVAQISATPPHYSYFNLIFSFFFFPPIDCCFKIAAAILSQKQKSTADLECECETFSAAKC